MTTEDRTGKRQCSSKEQCINPLGSWLPETAQYFELSTTGKNGLTGKCRLCHAKQRREKRKARSPEEAEVARIHKNDMARRNYQVNADKYRKRAREQYSNNQDKRNKKLEYGRKYRLEHPDKVNAARMAWVKRNKAHVRKYALDYRRTHPEYQRLNRRIRNARIRNNGGSFAIAELRILLKSQKRCWWCGKKIKGNNYHLDHRIPITKGGTNNIENICVSCPECNRSKHDKMPAEWNGRLL